MDGILEVELELEDELVTKLDVEGANEELVLGKIEENELVEAKDEVVGTEKDGDEKEGLTVPEGSSKEVELTSEGLSVVGDVSLVVDVGTEVVAPNMESSSVDEGVFEVKFVEVKFSESRSVLDEEFNNVGSDLVLSFRFRSSTVASSADSGLSRSVLLWSSLLIKFFTCFVTTFPKNNSGMLSSLCVS